MLVDGSDAAARTGRRGSDGQGRRRGAEGRRGARRRGHLKLLLVALGGGRIGGGAASDGGLMGGGKGSGTGILLWCIARRARGGRDGRWGSGCGSRRRASRPTEEKERARLQAALGGSGAARRWREYEWNRAQGWRRKGIERRGCRGSSEGALGLDGEWAWGGRPSIPRGRAPAGPRRRMGLLLSLTPSIFL